MSNKFIYSPGVKFNLVVYASTLVVYVVLTSIYQLTTLHFVPSLTIAIQVLFTWALPCKFVAMHYIICGII